MSSWCVCEVVIYGLAMLVVKWNVLAEDGTGRDTESDDVMM